MKAQLILLLAIIFVGFTFAGMNLKSHTLKINLHEDGSINIEEKYVVSMDNEVDVVNYNKAGEINTFSAWAHALNSSDVKIHIDTSKVDVENVEINPQPVKTTLSGKYVGDVLVSYDIAKGEELFQKKMLKPRVYVYSLNPDVLNYPKTKNGNLILNRDKVLMIVLPEGSEIVDVNPFPNNLQKVELPTKADMIYWNDIILVSFRLKVMVEESIPQEISQYFGRLISSVSNLLSEGDGQLLVGIAIFLGAAYLYIITTFHGGRYGANKNRSRTS